MNAIVTVIGKDRVGIIAEVCALPASWHLPSWQSCCRRRASIPVCPSVSSARIFSRLCTESEREDNEKCSKEMKSSRP